jgi:hypothetical protein
MSNDLVSLKFEKLAGDEDKENGTLTLKTHPPPTEIGPRQQTTPRPPRRSSPRGTSGLVRTPGTTAHEGPDSDANTDRHGGDNVYKLPDPKLSIEENGPRKQLAPEIYRSGGSLPFESLAAERALPPLPVVVRLVADYLHRAVVVAQGDGEAVLVRGNAIVVDAVRVGPDATAIAALTTLAGGGSPKGRSEAENPPSGLTAVVEGAASPRVAESPS